MKKLILLFALLIFACSSDDSSNTNNDLTISIEFVGQLEITESSGLINIQNQLVSHNDSGGDNKIYIINKENASIQSELTVLNSLNIDWEDVSIDSNYIYIGDFGNNYGNRDDLVIYKVTILRGHTSYSF